jgi:hypothetical protein
MDKNLGNQKVAVPGLNPDLHKKSWFGAHKILGYSFLIAITFAIITGVYYYQVSIENLDYYHNISHHSRSIFWKTYTSTQYGLDLKYPPSFRQITVQAATQPGKKALASFVFKSKDSSATSMIVAGDMKIDVAVIGIAEEAAALSKSQNLSFDQWFDQLHKVSQSSAINNTSVRQTEFQGLPAISQIYNTLKPTEGLPSAKKEVYVKLNSDEVLVFTFSSPLPGGERLISVLDKILSTAQLSN